MRRIRVALVVLAACSDRASPPPPPVTCGSGGPSTSPPAPALASGFVHHDRFPAHGAIEASWTIAPDDVWAVGADHTVVHWDGRSWSLADPPSDCSYCLLVYNYVWASGHDDVWVVGTRPGYESHGGDVIEYRASSTEIVHWDGHRWANVAVAALGQRLVTGIHGSGPRDIWLTTAPTGDSPRALPPAGDAFVLHFDGTRFRSYSLGVSYMRAPWANRPDDAWLVGNSAVWHWNGATWTRDTHVAHPIAIWGTPAETWIEAESGAVFHRDVFGVWSQAAASPPELVSTVWPGATTWERTAAGLQRWERDHWVRADIPKVDNAVAGGTALDAWVFGTEDKTMVALHGDGRTWTPMRSTTRRYLTNMSFAAPDDGWAVATEWDLPTHTSSSDLLHWDGIVWRRATQPPLEAAAVWAIDAHTVWVVGATGIVRWDGTTWSSIPSDGAAGLRAVWGTSATDLWAAGCANTLVHWDGVAWRTVAIPIPVEYQGICVAFGGSGPNDVWAVAPVGNVFHWDGHAWSKVNFGLAGLFDTESGMSGGLSPHAVWAASPTDVWMVGGGAHTDYPLILHFDGHTWTRRPRWRDVPPIHVLREQARPGSDHELYGIWGRAANDVWAVGDGGLAFHYDGTAWTEFPTSPTDTRTLLSVTGTPTGDTWFGGWLGSEISVARDATLVPAPPPAEIACDPKPVLTPEWWKRGDASCPPGAVLDGEPPKTVSCKTVFGERHGPEMSFWPSGAIQDQTSYVHGAETGVRTIWNERGVKTYELSQCDDVTDGRFRRWTDDGTLIFDGTYVRGVPDGTIRMWATNGRALGAFDLPHGTGHIVWFYDDGVKSGDGDLVDGKKAGVWTDYWGNDGKKRGQGPYVHDRRNGMWTEWRPNGTREAEGRYVDDVKEGPWTMWSASGQATRVEMVHGYARTR